MIKWFFKKLVATACALAGMFAFNSLGMGFTLGLNLLNAAIIGFLGVPGIVSVLGLHLLL